jgi:hypothetical protein
MMGHNLYRAPEANGDRPSRSARARDIPAAAWRGAEFGAKIVGGIMATFCAAFIASIFWIKTFEDFSNDFGEDGPQFFAVASLVLVTGAAIFGAVLGAIIWGIAETVRPRREGRPPGRATMGEGRVG